MQQFFQSYFSTLASTPLNQITEHTHRGALQDLIRQIAETNENKIAIIHEPTNQQGLGRPDFLIKSTASQSILWYIENKKIGENLIDITKTDQIAKYRKLCENILLTNYTDWIWICGDSIQSASLCNTMDLANPKSKLNPDHIEAVVALISWFLSQAPVGINNIKSLAEVLAVRADLLEDILREAFVDKWSEQDPKLAEIYGLLKSSIDHTLTEQKFIDIFVQTLTYWLFLAKLNNRNASIDLTNARKYISESFPVIKYLVGFLDVLDGYKYVDTKWIFEEMLAILDTANREGIKESLKFAYGIKKEENLFEDGYIIKDPYVHFYEDFLTKYNNKLKFETGSFYTPLPVVDFIIRAVDRVLSEKLGIKKWLADKDKVTVLDFATGTGTFLYEAINFVLKKTAQKNPAFVRETIEKHIIPHFHGLELMMAPYTIAHLKITGLLGEYAYHLSPEERLKIYLTNTLDYHDDTKGGMFSTEMAQENIEANKVKSQPILAIIGNPPYSGISQNPWLYEDDTTGVWVYKYIDDVHFWERKHWLNDDYVKFIRFAEKKIEWLDEGVVAIITNHGFLDNPTFRGMRHHLMQTFDQMYFVDLHGNSTKKETCPDWSKDENVFDIKAGVAISILIKSPKLSKSKAIYHTDARWTRKEKYQWLNNIKIQDILWTTLIPKEKFFFFIPHSINHSGYDKWIKLDEIFLENTAAIVSANDELNISITQTEQQSKIKDILEMNESERRIKYKRQKDSRDWRYIYAKEDAEKNNKLTNYKIITYRPFDKRHTLYTWKSKWLYASPQNTIMKNMHYLNLWLCIVKQYAENEIYNHVYIVDSMIDNRSTFSSKWTASLIPLFLYSDDGSERKLNIKPEIVAQLIEKYQLTGDEDKVGRQIMSYIYAILYSPSYRTQFSQFLKSDFPRIPWVESREDFVKLAELGSQLIDLHLLHDVPEIDGLGLYPIAGDNIIGKKISRTDDKLYINDTQYFDHVPAQVRNFVIGWYQVIDKWLKSRKGRTLTMDDVEHLQQVMSSLYETDRVMKEIDMITGELHNWE